VAKTAQTGGHTADPTPGAASSVPYPRLVAAEGSLRELINDDSLEESKFPGGRVYWPDDDTDAIRVDLDWDRDNNQLP
jgi:hypothetical protein